MTDREDHLHAATFEITLNPGESLTFVASTAPQPNLDGLAALKSYCARSRKLLDLWKLNRTETFTRKQNCPAWIDLLVLAADQFIVDRSVPEVPNGKTIIAGYHWFGDWGRDTMISLPELTIATGRFGKANATRTEIARSILLTFAKYVDCGTSPESFSALLNPGMKHRFCPHPQPLCLDAVVWAGNPPTLHRSQAWERLAHAFVPRRFSDPNHAEVPSACVWVKTARQDRGEPEPKDLAG